MQTAFLTILLMMFALAIFLVPFGIAYQRRRNKGKITKINLAQDSAASF